MTAADRVLIAAEARVRTGGYNGFSFRDIARDTGLTNAGVHHHFPTKAALVARLATDYTARFIQALKDAPPGARVAQLRALFSESFRKDGRMCLCGLLAAESADLPDAVADAARAFFTDLVGMLAPCFADAADPNAQALRVLAQLEGAVLLANTLKDPDVLDQATADLAA